MILRVLSRTNFAIFFVLIACVCRSAPAQVTEGFASVTPILHAHAHNDYEHARPLFDALDNGFCSVEADVHLVNGELFVAHDLKDIRPGRTLESLYLEPLKARIDANHGRVYPDGPSVVLLIDQKTGKLANAEQTYAAVHATLMKYAPYLTCVAAGKVTPGAITIIMTGGRARKTMEAEEPHYTFYDGTLDDLDSDAPTWFIPWISTSWKKSFTWTGQGNFPPDDRAKLLDMVHRAHDHHRQLRLWEAPDNPTAWKVLRDAGVDLINTDDLKGCREFLLKSE
jgi:hypothetical protein